MMPIDSLAYAKLCDQNDALAPIKSQFHIPTHAGKPCLYFTGNSLGLQPKNLQALVVQELDDWARWGVEGHLHAKNPWLSYHEAFSEPLSKLVGAKPSEVVVMNTLSANLHFLLVSFYQPKGKKVKILCEQKPFPSDTFVLKSQLKFHGLDPTECLIEVSPKNGHTLSTQEILQKIEEHKEELALVFIGGVHYYTGQRFNMQAIAEKAQQHQIPVGFDLAHAVGNVELQLHDWNVDFAAWCSYKYLNAGPGAVGGIYINQKHHQNPHLPKFTGWWGHNKATRFEMGQTFDPTPTAESWQTSNAPVFNMVGLKASLEIFEQVPLSLLFAKRDALTQYLWDLLQLHNPGNNRFTIITPSNPQERGAQLSLLIHQNGKALFQYLSERGVVADWRSPDVIRVAPAPLYNTYEDVWQLSNHIQAFYSQNNA